MDAQSGHFYDFLIDFNNNQNNAVKLKKMFKKTNFFVNFAKFLSQEKLAAKSPLKIFAQKI